MQDAFGVDRESIAKSNPFSYKDSKDRTRVDTPANLAIAGGVGAAAGMAGDEAVRGVRETRSAIKGMSPADSLQWRSLSRAKRAKDAVGLAASPAFRALKRPSTAIAAGGTAAIGAGIGLGTKKHWEKKTVAKAAKQRGEEAAATAGGAAASGGAVALGRKRWAADNLHPNAHSKTERAIWSSKVLPKSAQTPGERALGLVARPGLGRLGNLPKGKTAALVGGSAAAAGGTAAGINAARKDKGRPHL